MTTDEMKAREAAAYALQDFYYPEAAGECQRLGVTPAQGWMDQANAAIDAYLAALSPLPDEQLDEAWEAAYKMWACGLYAPSQPVTRGEFRERMTPLLRALSSHPDEETRRNEVVITARQVGKTAQMVEMLLAIAAERRLDIRVIEPPPDEETVTSEPDVTWPGDLRESSRVRSSRELIREANSIRDLDGTGIVGRLADMLAGWLRAHAEDTGTPVAELDVARRLLWIIVNRHVGGVPVSDAEMVTVPRLPAIEVTYDPGTGITLIHACPTPEGSE